MLERVTAAQALQGVIGALRGGAGLDEVLATLLEEARAMLEADEAYILLREGGQLRLRAGIGLPSGAAGRGLRLEEGLEGWTATHREAVIVPAADRDPRYRDPFGRTEPAGALAAYPLVLRDEAMGVIVAARRSPGRFGGADLWWLDLLGGLAAAVVESDAARRAQERRARQAEILAEIGSRPRSPGAAAPVGRFDLLVSALTRGLGADYAAVYLLDATAGGLTRRAVAGEQAAGEWPPDRVDLQSREPLAWAHREGAPLLLSPGDSSLASLGSAVRSAVGTPIQVGGDRRGVLLLASRSRDAFSQPDQLFLQVVAARIGMTLEEEQLAARRLDLERERAEADARQAFVGVISHELKTPVAVIQAYTDLLLRRAERAGDEGNLDILQRIGDQADRMLGLIDQLLDLQRLEAGLFTLEPSRFDLAALAVRVGEEAEATARGEGVTVATYSDPPRIPVVADRRRVEEVLQNLLQNAVKYTRAGSKVELRLRESNGQAIVSVRDQGVGIMPDEQARVFDRFYQGRNRLGAGHVGLGLGLYISREIVRRHGGEIWLESAPERGSTFYFSLPLQGAEAGES